ncbi:MAG: carbohydrate ABC transporter permease [Clostridiales bacterium]|nr:carbohydrate ABC transporter permease [Clostridiales bacterium]
MITQSKSLFPRKRRRRTVWSILGELLLLILAIMILIPFYYMIVNVFKTQQEMAKTPLALPTQLYFDNFKDVFKRIRFGTALKNTTLITFFSIILVIVLGSMSGYAVARRKHWIYKGIMLYFLLGFMVPVQTTMIPLFLLMQKMKLINTIPGVIVLMSGGCTFAFFLYQGFVSTVPMDLEESARIDGASVLRVFVSIIFPLLQPVTVTLTIFHIMGTWNDFVTPFLFLSSRENTTLMLEMRQGVGEFSTDWPMILSTMTVVISPLVIFYLFAQRYIIDGLVSGALKG